MRPIPNGSHSKKKSYANVRHWLHALLFLFVSQSLLAFDLTGTVYGDSNPLPAATVHLYDAGQSPLSDATTDGAGAYSFTSLSDGTYWLNVTPPGGSGYTNSPLEQVVVAGGNVAHSVALVSSTGVNVTGTVRGHLGIPLMIPPNTDGSGVRLYSMATDIYYPIVGAAPTDATGRYSITVPPGEYRVLVESNMYFSNWSNGPSEWQKILNSKTVTGTETVIDINLDFIELTGKILDGNGVPVAGVELHAYSDGQDADWMQSINYGHGYPTAAVSDASGNYSLLLVDNPSAGGGATANITLVPPADRPGLVQTTIPVTVASNTTRDLVIGSGTLVTGTVRAQGVPVTVSNTVGDGVHFYNLETGIYYPAEGSAPTDVTGKYAITVPPGTYRVDVEASMYFNNWSDGPSHWQKILNSETVTGSETVIDINLDFIELTGKILDGNGVPVAGVELHTYSGGQDTDWSQGVTYGQGYPTTAVSDASGNYSLLLVDNPSGGGGATASITLRPPADRTDLVETTTDVVVPGNTSRDLVIGTGTRVTGTVRAQGVPVMVPPNAEGSGVQLYNMVTDRYYPGTSAAPTDAAGSYSITVPPGEYRVLVDSSMYFSNWSNGPSGWGRFLENKTVSGTETVIDINLDFIELSGKVLDDNGAPVAGVELHTASSGMGTGWGQYVIYGQSYPTTAISDANGNFLLLLVDNPSAGGGATQDILFKSKSGSGFVETTLKNFHVSGNQTMTVYLQHTDTTPPKIISGPLADKIENNSAVINWETSEPTTGTLGYEGGSITVSTASTVHSVAVAGLTPGTTYHFQVNPVDTSANAGVASAVTVTTKTVADTTPPSLALPPTASMSGDSAHLVFEGSEPVTGALHYGAGSPSGSSMAFTDLAVTHTLDLTGLSANTTYSYQIQFSDAAGNGPVLSPVYQFTTPPVADTLPPVIISGPIVRDTGKDAVTIIWDTNEPAISGVSWNDGTHYDLITDNNLITHHEFRVSGLTASTVYNVTVSSTDKSGNGPTLGGPVQIKTLAALDVAGPCFEEHPVPQSVNQQQAMIRFRVCEAASAVVEYGVASGGFTHAEAEAQLKVNHVIKLPNLLPDTQYNYRVTVKDPYGNTTVAPVATFHTDKFHGAGKGEPAFTLDPVVTTSTEHSVTVAWEADEPVVATIEHGAGTTVEEREEKAVCDAGKKQVVTLTDFDPAETKNVKLTITDMDGNKKTRTAAVTSSGTAHASALDVLTAFVSEAIADLIPPAPPYVSGVTADETSHDRTLLRWVTDIPADSRIAFGVDGDALEGKSGDNHLTNEHTLLLTGLSPGTTYRVAASGYNAVNGLAAPVEIVFTTAASAEQVAPAITTATATLVDGQTMQLDWSNTGFARVEIQYGLNPAALDGREFAASYAAAGSYRLKNLDPGKTWYAKLVFTDPSGNKASSALLSVQTADADSDGDGRMDSVDAFPADPAEWQDTDGDHIGNNADMDDDGDGVPDYIDSQPLNSAIKTEKRGNLNNLYKGARVQESVRRL